MSFAEHKFSVPPSPAAGPCVEGGATLLFLLVVVVSVIVPPQGMFMMDELEAALSFANMTLALFFGLSDTEEVPWSAPS